MKKLVFTLMVVFFGAAGLMAQSAEKAKCSKDKAACCASKKSASTASVSTEMNAKVLSMAKSIADKDETITTRQCAESGTVGFYKKNVCSTSGKISYNEVQFDQATKTFVNTSPTDVQNANQGTMIKVVNMENGTTSEATVDAKETKKCASKAGKKCCASKAKKAEGSQK